MSAMMEGWGAKAKPGLAFLLLIPALLLLGLAVAIVLEPTVLVWLVAALVALLGLLLLKITFVARRFLVSLRDA